MENSHIDSEEHSANALESNVSNTVNSSENKKGRKPKKQMRVEKLGENSDYDDSLLKRRK